MLNIAFGQSKYYIGNLRQNIKRGLRQKVRKGIYPGKALLGYLNKLDDHTIVKDPENWRKVKKVFEAYATGKYMLDNLRGLALSLGLVSPRSKKKLSNATTQRMLQNLFYYGCFEYKREPHEGVHEPIISKQLFDKVQKVMKDRGKPRKDTDHDWAFLDMFTCGERGRSITAEQHTKKSGLVFRYTITPLKKKRSFGQIIGSNWRLKDKKPSFSPKNQWKLLLRPAEFGLFPEWSG